MDDKRAEKIKKFVKEYIKAKLEAKKDHKKSRRQDVNKIAERAHERGKPDAHEAEVKDKNSDDDGNADPGDDHHAKTNRKRRSPPGSPYRHVNGNGAQDYKKIRSETHPRPPPSMEEENDVPMDLSE